MRRTVEPEILDGLPHDDPAAVRSRRDLRRINAVMGNHRWLCGEVGGGGRVIELGAGDGGLAGRLADSGARVTGLDLAPAPKDLAPGVSWREGDLFETLPSVTGDALVGCLILHHFEGDRLGMLGEEIRENGVGRVLAVEPHRSGRALAQARLLFPFVNAVTRHDMVVSIRAGFREGELASALGMGGNEWEVRESVTLLGAYRFEAVRKC
jgi:hypothetical protein